jgi:hypothetical protein
MALMGDTHMVLRNTLLELKGNGDGDLDVYAESCPGSLEYEDLIGNLQDDIPEVGHDGATTMDHEHDNTGIVSAPNLRMGPEWGEPLRQCMDCGVEVEVGAVDPDDGLWSSLPLYCHDSM